MHKKDHRLFFGLAALLMVAGYGMSVGAFDMTEVAAAAGVTAPPHIQSVSTISGAGVILQIEITGHRFTKTGNTVNFGPGAIQNLGSPDGKTIRFIHPSTIGPACSPGEACPHWVMKVMPNTRYPVSVTNSNGTSNVVQYKTPK